MKRFESVQIGDCTLYLGDCLEILPTLGKVDAVVTDPPYGIGMDGGNVGYKGFNDFKKKNWDAAPPSMRAINQVISSAPQHIIWGGNYFDLPPTRCYLIWDKGAGFKGRSYAECEQAWTSLDANARIFKFDPLARGEYRGKSHPTQKPVELMKWCLQQIPKAQIILDPFMGSGSTGVACVALGRGFIGIERDAEYFEVACKRVSAAISEPRLPLAEPKPKQEAMTL